MDRVQCWELCPTQFPGAGDLKEAFYFALTFPSLFTSTRIYGGLRGGVGCVCLCFILV